MNALLIWQYLNAVAAPADRRFTRNFLVVAPNLIVYDRLCDSFLGKVDSATGRRDYATSDLRSQQDLFIPPEYRDRVHAFVQGSTVTKHEIGRRLTAGGVIALTNWNLLAGKDKDDPNFLPEDLLEVDAPGSDLDPKQVAGEALPLSPIKSGGHSLDTLDAGAERGKEFRWLRDLSGGLLVINDEAHHTHGTIRTGQQVDTVEWQKALDALAEPRTAEARYTQLDFTATPFLETGGRKRKGGGTNRVWFPHIVTDFDLNAAIRTGLVKSIALDRRSEIGSIPNDELNFRTEKDGDGTLRISDGQATMLRAGLQKLDILERDFAAVDPTKHPKMLILTENTKASKAVEQFLTEQAGIREEELIRIDSNRKGEVKPAEWLQVRDRLFGIDHLPVPRIVVSVLMLREGFDVNNICVIVPLRATTSGILLEQVVGRGLRLMWRGNDDIDAAKAETRRRIANHQEPNNRYDLLSIIEHPAFEQWYQEQLGDGLLGSEGDDQKSKPSTGDIEVVHLRDDWEAYDIPVPFIVRDAEEELQQPSIDVHKLEVGRYPLADMKRQVGTGEHWVSNDMLEGTRYGDYRVDGGVFTATGYNDYLSRLTKHLADTVDRAYQGPDHEFTHSAKVQVERAEFPVLQVDRRLLIRWIDQYIRTRLFGEPLDPFVDENWRVLLLPTISGEIVRVFGPALVAQLDEVNRTTAEVRYRSPAEITDFRASASRLQDVGKCMYPKLRIAPAGRGGGLERNFVTACELDGSVEAYVKLDEHLHAFLQRPYVKDNGYPARYSPDFLVRTEDRVYVVETKSQTGLSDANVQRKRNAALSWVERINDLPASLRGGRDWRYVLVGEHAFTQSQQNGERLLSLLDRTSLYTRAQAEVSLF